MAASLLFKAGNNMERINYHTVENLADYCIAIGARLIHVSTYSTAWVAINNSVKSRFHFTEQDLYQGLKLR